MNRNCAPTDLKPSARKFLTFLAIVCLLVSAISAGASGDEGGLPELGDIILFGHYEQDNDPGNEEEPISWIVLALEGDRALLISEKNMDFKPYHTELKSITWETCTLRAWLNNDFMNTAFTEEEQKAVLTTQVKNEDNPEHGIEGGNDTSDRVFLLSIGEAESLFPANSERRSLNTAFTKELDSRDNDGFGNWWLRSPGYLTDKAAYVYFDGSIFADGNNVHRTQAVRPALWLDLSIKPDSTGHAITELITPFPATLGFLPVVGNVVTLGRYEQDNDPGNGKEPISWIVLEVEGNRVLLISEKLLDCKPYNTKPKFLTWESCTLRAWLNNDFLNTAFTEKEQKAILTTQVKNEDNPEHGTEGGDDTSDRVFLLSIGEAEKFFPGDADRRVSNTTYTMAQGSLDKGGYGYWWLRSPGYSQSYAAFVFTDGSLSADGTDVFVISFAVRPALYIGLDSDIF